MFVKYSDTRLDKGHICFWNTGIPDKPTCEITYSESIIFILEAGKNGRTGGSHYHQRAALISSTHRLMASGNNDWEEVR